MKKTLALAALTLCFSCASINSVSLTPVPKDRQHPISAQTSRWIILGFNFDNDYVDQLAGELKSQCPKGLATGILTKDEVIDYFLMLVHKRQVTASGYCVAGNP